MQFLRVVTLLAAAFAVTGVSASSGARPSMLRGLLAAGASGDASTSTDGSEATVQEISAVWEEAGKVGTPQALKSPVGEKIPGGEYVVVFHDRNGEGADKTEAAVVSFDVRSSANCVVSVCGELSKWYLPSKEQCFDLRIAPKSSSADKNGLIRGVSAAYTAQRPVADKLYLKFDAVNYIDGSACEYEILSGTKTVRAESGSSGGAVTSTA